MSKYNTDCYETMMSVSDIFPIEVDLPSTLIESKDKSSTDDSNDSNDEELVRAKPKLEDNVVDDLIGIGN